MLMSRHVGKGRNKKREEGRKLKNKRGGGGGRGGRGEERKISEMRSKRQYTCDREGVVEVERQSGDGEQAHDSSQALKASGLTVWDLQKKINSLSSLK